MLHDFTDTRFVSQLVIIDFDRTMGDVAAAMERMYRVVQDGDYEVDPALIAKVQHETEKQGQSFSPLSHLEALAPDMEQFKEEFLHCDEVPLLYDDVPLFLQVLEAKNIPYLVMSYGEDLEWQRLKIRASGYDGPIRLLSEVDKGADIARMAARGGYTYESDDYIFNASSVCLIDDKAKSFQSLPKDCSGVFLQRSETLLPSQQGDVPANVSVAASLEDLGIVGGCVNVPPGA